MRVLDKVRFDGSKTTVIYHVGEDNATIETTRLPSPEFQKALKGLAADVVDIAELPAEYAETIEVRSARFTWKEGKMGVVLSGVKRLSKSNAPLVINTPHRGLEKADEEGQGFGISEVTHKRLLKLIELTFDYIDGVGAQMELFGSGK